ncbi:MAG: DUF4926 domain-containing protein [Ruminococcaceae bacterium]|nr:DUF4926 domain-containing protein [Oscillospiraceae bacterium]
MKELDSVSLLVDFKNIPAGTTGVIVHEYDGTAFEVEYFNENGNTIDVITTPSNLITLEG